MKRILSVFVCMLMVVGLFAGCGDDTETVNSQTDNGDSIFSFEDVSFIENGESKYTIVRPETNTRLNEGTVAGVLFKQMKSVLNANFKNLSDSTDGADKYEILIGATNRPESQQALDYIESQGHGRYNDWIVCTIGKKIVINAYNAEKLDEATNYFINNFLKAEGIKGGIEYISYTQGDFSNIALNGTNIGKYTVVRPHYNFSYLAQVEIDAISDKVITATGFELPFVYDNTEPSEYEIIIGDAEREGVEALTDYDDYSIKISGKKVYINGGSSHALAVAINDFAKMLESGTVNDTKISGSYAQTVATYGDDAYKYVWGDEFDSETLDTTKWTQVTESDQNLGQNGKISVRSTNPNDVYIKDGKFYICAREDENYYYGGMIRTHKTMTYKYGFAEISVLIPDGDSFWVAWWTGTTDTQSSIEPTIPKYISPEIDIIECYGNSKQFGSYCHLWPTALGKEMGIEHYVATADEGRREHILTDDDKVFGDDFHTIGFLWDDKQMTFARDGEIYCSYDTTKDTDRQEAFNHSMYFIFSMAVAFDNSPGGPITQDPDEWRYTNKLVLDWLRLYQKNDGKHELDWKGANQ